MGWSYALGSGKRDSYRNWTLTACEKALEGSDDSGVYTPNFFVYADGIEIGFDLNYPEGDSHDLGYIWVTAPFETEELDAYHTDSTFWQAIRD